MWNSTGAPPSPAGTSPGSRRSGSRKTSDEAISYATDVFDEAGVRRVLPDGTATGRVHLPCAHGGRIRFVCRRTEDEEHLPHHRRRPALAGGVSRRGEDAADEGVWKLWEQQLASDELLARDGAGAA